MPSSFVRWRDRPVEVGPRHLGAAEIRVGQVGVGQIGSREQGALGLGSPETAPRRFVLEEIREAEIGVDEHGVAQRAAELRPRSAALVNEAYLADAPASGKAPAGSTGTWLEARWRLRGCSRSCRPR